MSYTLSPPSDADPGALANGEVHGDSLGKGGDIQKSTTAPPLSGDTPPPSGDTPAPSCADGVLENTPPEAARCVELVHTAERVTGGASLMCTLLVLIDLIG